MLFRLFRLALPLALLFVAAGAARAGGRGEPGEVAAVRIELKDRLEDLALLDRLDVDVDGVFGDWLRAYVLPEELEKLRGLGYEITPLDEPVSLVPSAYHTYETLTAELAQVAADHPEIARLHAIGTSVQGRTLWMMKISDNPDVEEDEPEVRYIAAMHGDEVVGKEMCIDLIHLLTDGYGTDPRLTSLVDDLEIWILPSMNPDGTAAGRRYNANNVDLNRNFPDQWTDPVDSIAGRQPEVQHVMAWAAAHAVVLSANFHGGAVVANYPYDATPTGSSVYSLTPDDALWVSLARTYADDNPSMRTSNADTSFTNGICNGADWYSINGGMQDWNYVWRGGRELTLEISSSKWPSGSTLPQFWEDNREAMLSYLERAREGVRGIVRDATTGDPLAATIRVVGSARDTFTDPDAGDYHRLLLPGTYALEISATGYQTARRDGVVVSASALAARVDADLLPLAPSLQAVSHRLVGAALEPGSTVDLAVTALNLGSTVTGVAAELVPAGWTGSVVRPEADYPDLAPGASAESSAPFHAVKASAAAPPGSKAGFALRWSASEGSGESAPFFVPIGPAICSTVAAIDLPKAIVDRGTTTSLLSFPATLQVSEVRVRVDLTHPYVGDLHVRAISPSGVPVALHSRTGGSADDIHGWYGAALTPSEPLSRYAGGSSAGIWRLEVVDGVPLNAGSLTAFSIEICGRPFEASLPPMRIRDVARATEGTSLTWWPYPGATSYKVYRSSSPSGTFTAAAQTPETTFLDEANGDLYWLVSGVATSGEGPINGP